jgi:hypothetical protein
LNGSPNRRSRLGGRLSLSVIATWAVLAVPMPHSLRAQQDERSVRAAFVYNLTKYVTWPASARELSICVVGGGATGSALKQVVEGKVSDGRTLHVLLDPTDASLRHCDIVYWSDSSTSRARSILDKTRGTSILTVGEDDKFVREGGMIGFVRTGDSIQVEVNLDSVKAGNLKISSRLLDLALIVHEGKRG